MVSYCIDMFECILDKDECKYRNVCPSNSVCQNTRGSFRCNCDAGFEQTSAQRCSGKTDSFI